MSNLLHYFSSFDKLMKEKLVAPLFWGLILLIGLNLLSEVFDTIGFDVLDSIIDFLNLFLTFLVAFVGIRVLCELAVAIFRINDNLSPDHGVSELADIDPVAEARRAAEDAARRARQGFDSALGKTQSVTSRAVDSTKATVSKATTKTSEAAHDLGERAEAAAHGVKARVKSTDAPKAQVARTSPPKARTPRKPSAKATTSTAPRKRGRPKGSKNKVRVDAKTGQRLKADGTPARKPGPKPKAASAKSGARKTTARKSTSTKSSAPRKRGRPKGSTSVTRYDPITGQRLKKDGTPAKKPGPKPK